MAQGATVIQTKSGHAHGGARQPVRRAVARRSRSTTASGTSCNEAGVRLTVHLGGTDYQKYGADWSEDPETVFGDFDAFQWMMYWGDRPAMELTVGADPAQLLRSLPQHQGVPLGAGHGVGAVHAPQDGPRVHDGTQGEVGGERPARRATVGDLPPALRRRAVPGGERAARRGRGRHRADRVRLRLPARRRPRVARGEYAGAQLGELLRRATSSASCATTSRTSSSAPGDVPPIRAFDRMRSKARNFRGRGSALDE